MREHVIYHKWVRDPNGWVAGVFEGLGKSFDINPNTLRLFWLISVVFFGTGIFFYLIAALTLPRLDELHNYERSKILGVCYNISQRTGMELGLVRFLAVLSLIFSAGTTLILYILFFFFLPEKDYRV